LPALETSFHHIEAVFSLDQAGLASIEDAFDAHPIVFDRLEALFTLRNHRA
jgi:hypothetical protein